MPMLRSRGGTITPSSGAETTRPPMLMRPPVACSSPATHRNVVVLPHHICAVKKKTGHVLVRTSGGRRPPKDA